jgi:hypothetical protein
MRGPSESGPDPSKRKKRKLGSDLRILGLSQGRWYI